jgi:hypothetical protein
MVSWVTLIVHCEQAEEILSAAEVSFSLIFPNLAEKARKEREFEFRLTECGVPVVGFR